MSSIGKMQVIKSTWNGRETFKLIPLESTCVYNEGIFDLDNKVLALIGKERKQSMHMVPKLNEFGDLCRLKIGKRDNGKDYSEERKTVETFYEYYLENAEDIKAFLELVAVTPVNVDQYLNASSAPQPPTSSILTGI